MHRHGLLSVATAAAWCGGRRFGGGDVDGEVVAEVLAAALASRWLLSSVSICCRCSLVGGRHGGSRHVCVWQVAGSSRRVVDAHADLLLGARLGSVVVGGTAVPLCTHSMSAAAAALITHTHTQID